jgi:hypothetical protein
MKRIKLSIAIDNEKCNRQLPGSGFVWKDYEFVINKPCEEADFWVVYSKGKREAETCLVAPQNTLFITGEPDSIYHYSQGYANQFGKVLSCQKKLKHKNLVYCQPAQPWHIGKLTRKIVGSRDEEEAVAEYTHTYDDFKVSVPQKTKLISVITSNKAFTKGHRERIEFVMKLKEHYGEKLDMFGWGFNGFDNKWDVIAPYKYHIALENNSTPYYWTEKLADAYLGNAFPIYYGADNIGDFFSEDSYLAIDIHNVEDSIKKIDYAITNDLAVKNAAAVEESKQRVLDKYNLFNLIVEQIQDMNPDAEKKEVTIKPDMSFLDFKKLYVMGWKRAMNTINAKLNK